jgi:hypothetical protein
MKLIPVNELEVGRIYLLDCRNLYFGVYAGEGIFVGVREKFGDRFLDREYHYDTSRQFGTVEGMEPTNYTFECPDSIEDLNHKDLFEFLEDLKNKIEYDDT